MAGTCGAFWLFAAPGLGCFALRRLPCRLSVIVSSEFDAGVSVGDEVDVQ